jgi:peptidyl-dipeptidase Dcp
VGGRQYALERRAIPDLLRPPRSAREGLAHVRNRGDNGGKTDNNAIIAEILKLRAERAKLLGYATYAHWRLEKAWRRPRARVELMQAVWTPAVARVHEEVADMQAIADKEGANLRIEPWDYRYYAEKVRKAKYDLDENEITPYLQLDKLRDGMFYMAQRLFGFTFTPLPGRGPCTSPTCVWKVTNRKVTRRSLVFRSLRAHGQASGAWMNAYRTQERFEQTSDDRFEQREFRQGKTGEPCLISWTDATTLFHEFGHALHGLSSNVQYPSFVGTRVARDYVEFPSQLLEHWLSTPEILNRYAFTIRPASRSRGARREDQPREQVQRGLQDG